MFNNFHKFSDIISNFQKCIACSYHFQLYKAISSIFQPFKDISSHFQPFTDIASYFQLNLANSSHCRYLIFFGMTCRGSASLKLWAEEAASPWSQWTSAASQCTGQCHGQFKCLGISKRNLILVCLTDIPFIFDLHRLFKGNRTVADLRYV